MRDDSAIADDLKHAMRALAKAVVLIACRSADGERFVMPATAVTPVSMDPPSVLICVNRSVSSHAVLASGADFSISLLRADQVDIARLCTGSANRDRRFSKGTWAEAQDGTPYLADALAAIVCRTDHRVSYGTHDVFFGKVHEVLVNAVDDPLVYADGRYVHLGAAIAD